MSPRRTGTSQPPIGLPVPLTGGLNISVPRSSLAPGELAIARNCHYRDDSPQLTKVRGRSLFGSLSEQVNGLTYLRFRSAKSFLIGGAGTSMYTAPVQGTGVGTFTSRASSLAAGGSLSGVYFDGTDLAYLSDGKNRMQVWGGSGAMRNGGGLTPATAIVATFLNNATTLYVNGTIFTVCYTEYNSTTGVESPPSAVSQIEASAVNGTFKYAFPAALTNAGFDKVRLYRTQFGGGVFYRLSEFAVQASIIYYDGTNTDAGSPAHTNADTWGTGFDTVDDIFLSSQPVLEMVGEPLHSNYITVNGEIPRGDISFVWQNRLIVTGNPDYPLDVYGSMADFPEHFSPASFIREENGRGEPVTGGGIVNDQMIIFTANSQWRHNNFPSVIDPGFALGLSTRELVTDDHGCIAKRTVINFGIGQPNNRLFYLSANGPMMSDSFTTWPLHSDLGWDLGYFNIVAMSGAVAINYPKYRQVWLFLPSAGSNTNDIAMIYHYHPYHMKNDPVGKWTGPVDVRCAAATAAHEIDTQSRMFVADTDTSGSIYEEDSGLKDEQLNKNSAGDIDWEWMTGDYTFGEESANKRVQRVFLSVVDAKDFSPKLKFAVNKHDSEYQIHLENQTTNFPSEMRFGSSLVAEIKTRSYRGGVHQTGSHFRWHMQETGQGPRAVISLELEMQPFGRQR